MLKRTFLILISGAAALNLGCQSVEKTNGNTAVVTNTTTAANANVSANIPPEFSGNKISDAANSSAPVASNVAKGATPTPGIPDPATIGKTPQPKNTPKIPGIPTEEELKKQTTVPITNAKIRDAKPPITEVNSNVSATDRPRTARTP